MEKKYISGPMKLAKEILKTEIVKNKNLVNVDDDLDLTKPQLKKVKAKMESRK